MTPELILDPAIKLWALLPILAVMVMVGLAKHYTAVLLTPTPPQASAKELKEQAYLRYAHQLRANAYNLGAASYTRRIASLVPEFRRGIYIADPEASAPSAIPNLLDPRSSEMMLSNVRQQVLSFVPQTLVMQWVTAFFGSLVVMKLPFPLASKFKDMLQANLYTHDLDVRWVSAISFYILLVLGLDGVYSLFLGKNYDLTGSRVASGATPALIPASVNRQQLFSSEADLLELEKPKYVLNGVCERVAQAY